MPQEIFAHQYARHEVNLGNWDIEQIGQALDVNTLQRCQWASLAKDASQEGHGHFQLVCRLCQRPGAFSHLQVDAGNEKVLKRLSRIAARNLGLNKVRCTSDLISEETDGKPHIQRPLSPLHLIRDNNRKHGVIPELSQRQQHPLFKIAGTDKVPRAEYTPVEVYLCYWHIEELGHLDEYLVAAIRYLASVPHECLEVGPGYAQSLCRLLLRHSKAFCPIDQHPHQLTTREIGFFQRNNTLGKAGFIHIKFSFGGFYVTKIAHLFQV